MKLPESCLSNLKSSGSPPMNTPVFSPIMVLPLEADAVPGVVKVERWCCTQMWWNNKKVWN